MLQCLFGTIPPYFPWLASVTGCWLPRSSGLGVLSVGLSWCESEKEEREEDQI